MENNLYETYATTPCQDIPVEYLKQLILVFLIGASQDMGQVFDRNITPDRVYDIIKTHYSTLPLSLIASAFKRGSLGIYGAGRLVPKTIFNWLSEINQYYLTVREKQDHSLDKKNKFNDLGKYPLGKAICKKIDWLKSGAITSSEWDKISLEQVAELIGSGREPSLEYFGINKQNN